MMSADKPCWTEAPVGGCCGDCKASASKVNRLAWLLRAFGKLSGRCGRLVAENHHPSCPGACLARAQSERLREPSLPWPEVAPSLHLHPLTAAPALAEWLLPPETPPCRSMGSGAARIAPRAA